MLRLKGALTHPVPCDLADHLRGASVDHDYVGRSCLQHPCK
jgi:hypothetical protein